MSGLLDAALGFAVGFLSSALFVVVLVVGFCVAVGFLKLKPAARSHHVVRSLDDALARHGAVRADHSARN